MTQISLQDSVRLVTDEEGRLRLKLKKEFYEFVTQAAIEEGPEDPDYVMLCAGDVVLEQRAETTSHEFVRADDPEIRMAVARFGDDPPCLKRWQ